MAVQACKLNVKEKSTNILYQIGGDIHIVFPMIMLRVLKSFQKT